MLKSSLFKINERKTYDYHEGHELLQVMLAIVHLHT